MNQGILCGHLMAKGPWIGIFLEKKIGKLIKTFKKSFQSITSDLLNYHSRSHILHNRLLLPLINGISNNRNQTLISFIELQNRNSK